MSVFKKCSFVEMWDMTTICIIRVIIKKQQALFMLREKVMAKKKKQWQKRC